MRTLLLLLAFAGWAIAGGALREHHHIFWATALFIAPIFWCAGYYTGHNAHRHRPTGGWRLSAYRFLINDDYRRDDPS